MEGSLRFKKCWVLGRACGIVSCLWLQCAVAKFVCVNEGHLSARVSRVAELELCVCGSLMAPVLQKAGNGHPMTLHEPLVCGQGCPEILKQCDRWTPMTRSHACAVSALTRPAAQVFSWRLGRLKDVPGWLMYLMSLSWCYCMHVL